MGPKKAPKKSRVHSRAQNRIGEYLEFKGYVTTRYHHFRHYFYIHFFFVFNCFKFPVLRSATRVRMQMGLGETEFNRMINCTVALTRVPSIDRMGLLNRRVMRSRRASMSNFMVRPKLRLRSNSLNDRPQYLAVDSLAKFRRQLDEAVQAGDIKNDSVSEEEND